MSRIRWGILGCGWIAEHAIAPALADLDNATVHSACSRAQTKANAFCKPYAGARGFEKLDAFLADPDLDAVYVATPNFRHADDVLACAAAGKHVLCDKPLAADAAQAARMVASCAKAGIKLGTGFQLRFHPAHQEMIRRVAAGELGTLSHAHVQMCFRYPQGPSEWRKDLHASGGGWATNDLGSHLADLLIAMLGPVARVQAVLANRVYGYPGEDLGTALIEFQNGAVATYVCSTGANTPASQVAIYGSAGYLYAEGTMGLGAGGTLKAGDGMTATPVAFAFERKTLYHAELEAFGNAIIKDAPPPISGEAGLRVAELLDAMRLAAQQGRAVAVAR